jgi:hypothetical protein
MSRDIHSVIKPESSARKGSGRSAEYLEPRTRLWLILAWYVGCALGGALLGRRYYLPTPPALETLIISDLRYAGALAGASAGAMSTALLRRWHPRHRLTRGAQLALLIVASVLAYALCETSFLLGFFTLTAIALPIPFTIARRLTKGANTSV